MNDRTGQQLGNYRLLRLLGQGGFAEVYLAQHQRLKTHVAIKVLRTQLAYEDVSLFQREAELVAALVHPHIVRVFDFDVQQGVAFLVMDYAPQGSLRQQHPKGSIVPLPTIVSYVTQIAKALQYAHDQKLIHRDVKPENMLLGRDGEVLLSDFGIATIAHNTSTLTAQTMAGTAPYMAPEQIQAHPRPASDQYALAVVVYEWLCGERPFQGSPTEIAIKHCMVPPPSLCEKMPSIPSEVEHVVLTALAKDPKQRFANVQAFATALEKASRPEPPLLLPEEFSTAKSSSIPESISIPASPLSIPNSAPSTAIAYNGSLANSTLFMQDISTPSQPSATVTLSPSRGVLVDYLFPSNTSQRTNLLRNGLLILGCGTCLFLCILLLALPLLSLR